MLGLEFICKIVELQYTELAEQLGVKKQSVSAWVNGRVAIPKKFIPVLVEKFGVDSKYLEKPLSEVDKIEIQQQMLNRQIRQSIEHHEDETIDLETVDLDLIQQSQILSLQKEQSETLEKIVLSVEEVQKYTSNMTEQVYKSKEVLDLYKDLSYLLINPAIRPSILKSMFIALGMAYGVNMGMETGKFIDDLLKVLDENKK